MHVASRIGERIGPYEVLREVGRGGMGVVFEARDERLHRSVALKALHDDRIGGRDTRERLQREARAASGISHPFVVQVYDVLDHGGHMFVVMEYVAGDNLQQRLAGGPLSVMDAVNVASDLANALSEAHARRVLHLDIKPSNVLIGAGGHPRLVDFGIARALPAEDEALRALNQTVGTGAQPIGTPGYMSPEQALGKAVDARSDLFSLGVVIYEMLTGRNPFAASNAAAAFYALFTQTPPPPSEKRDGVPAELDDLVMKMIQREPGLRPPSARLIEHHLQQTQARMIVGMAGSVMGRIPMPEAPAAAPPRTARQPVAMPEARPAPGLWALLFGWLRPTRPTPQPEPSLLETMLEGTRSVEASPAAATPDAIGSVREQRTRPAPQPAGRQTATARTQYAKSGDVSIAYQVSGDGPLDIVYVPGWVSHIEYAWQVPSLVRWLSALRDMGRLITFDKRGTGLSDRVPVDALPTLEQRMDDVRAVMDAAGSRRAVVIGVSEGSTMSLKFAATYPERVLGVVTVGGYAARRPSPDYPWAPDPADRLKWIEEIERSWGGETDLTYMAPSLAGDPEEVRHLSTYFRLGASPGAAVALARMNSNVDVRDELPRIQCPALVVHRTGDKDAPIEGGRYIAAHVPGARLVELPGDDHMPGAGDMASIVDAISTFCAECAARGR